MTFKQKQTPQRIRINLGHIAPTTVYVSCRIAKEIRSLCLRGNQNILLPLKGNNEELVGRLVYLCKQHPDEFMSGSRSILGVHV